MLNHNQITIKGKSPEKQYDVSLKDVFFSLPKEYYSLEECLKYILSRGVSVKKEVLQDIVTSYKQNSHATSDELPFSFAGPFQMKSVLDTFFLYNLEYQNTVIQIELEKSEKLAGTILPDSEWQTIYVKTLHCLSVILRTCFFSGKPLYLELTNIELDYIVLKTIHVLNLFPIKTQRSEDDLIAIGNTANELAAAVYSKIFPAGLTTLQDLFPYFIYSGTIWWSDPFIQQEYKKYPGKIVAQLTQDLQNLAQKRIVLDDSMLFIDEVLKSKRKKHLVFYFDDNGELFWDLLFIKIILQNNENIHITGFVNKIPVTNNAHVITLNKTIETNMTLELLKKSKRFTLKSDSNYLSTFDPRFISNEMVTILNSADVCIIKGVSYFEKNQYIPIPVYYAFTVYSDLSQFLTGLDKFSGVFTRLGPFLCGFSHISLEAQKPVIGMNLIKCADTLRSSEYKNFCKKYKNERDAHRYLIHQSFSENLPFITFIQQINLRHGADSSCKKRLYSTINYDIVKYCLSVYSLLHEE